MNRTGGSTWYEKGKRTMKGAARDLEPFVKQWAILLTTYRRDGSPVGTTVNVVVEGDHAYFRTWDTAWKLKRIRNDPKVQFGGPVGVVRTIVGLRRAAAAYLKKRDLERQGIPWAEVEAVKEEA